MALIRLAGSWAGRWQSIRGWPGAAAGCCAALGCGAPAAKQAPPPATAAATPLVPLDDPASCVDAAANGSDAEIVALPDTADAGYRLAPSAIRAAVKARLSQIGDCYGAALERHSPVQGLVTYRFVVDESGQVTQLGVSQNGFADCRLVQCIREEFQQLELPRPQGGPVSVAYPLSLQAE